MQNKMANDTNEYIPLSQTSSPAIAIDETLSNELPATQEAYSAVDFINSCLLSSQESNRCQEESSDVIIHKPSSYSLF